jgi:hypothetical protein
MPTPPRTLMSVITEPEQVPYIEKLTALTQRYLELELSLTDAILAAEADLVTWIRMNYLLGHFAPER